MFILTQNRIKEVPLGEGQVLVIKDKDELYAISTKCSHAGAPLKTGVQFISLSLF